MKKIKKCGKLNLGCCQNIKEGYVNLDIVKREGVDVIHDLNKIPYPFETSSVDLIYCSHIIEHLDIDTVTFMKEVHRIIKPRGIVIIRVPHFSNRRALEGIGHKRVYASDSFNRNRYPSDTPDTNTKLNFLVRKKKIIFGKKYNLLNYLIEPITNINPFIYEDSFLRAFPAQQLYFELEPINKEESLEERK